MWSIDTSYLIDCLRKRVEFEQHFEGWSRPGDLAPGELIRAEVLWGVRH